MKHIANHYRASGWVLAVLLCSSMALALSRADTTQSNLTKTFTVKPGGQLVVEADRGSIEIRTSDRNDLQVDVERTITKVSKAKAEEVFAAHEVTFDQDGDRVEVRAKSKSNLSQWFNRGAQNLQVHYRILAPKRFDFDLRTAAGDITASEIQGKVKARTAGGGLKFAAVDGSFEGNTSAGDIELAGASGPVHARTAGGGIRLGELSADASAETSAGSINIKSSKAKLTAVTHGGGIDLGEALGPAELDTSAGSIHVKSSAGRVAAKTAGGEIKIDDAHDTVVAQTAAGSIAVNFSAQPHDDCKLTTAGGGITVKVADKLAFDVDAKTSGGEVKTELPVQVTVVGKHRADELKGKLNGGGKALILKTSAGDIRLLQLPGR